MFRKLLPVSLAAALGLGVAGNAAAQDFVFGWNPRTGDVWVDQQLRDINDYGYRYRDPFIDEMTRNYGAPRDLVYDLLVNQRWAPGDIYYACAIGQVIGQPCRQVVDEWGRDHGQGWGVVAQRLGIKPGSPEFHRLKKGFVPTYDRWGRPISLDERLRTDYPDRGRGPHGIDIRVAHGSPGMANGRGNGKGRAGDHPGGGLGKGAAMKSGHGPDRHGPPSDKGHGAGDHGPAAGKGQDGKGKGRDKGHGNGHGKG